MPRIRDGRCGLLLCPTSSSRNILQGSDRSCLHGPMCEGDLWALVLERDRYLREGGGSERHIAMYWGNRGARRRT